MKGLSKYIYTITMCAALVTALIGLAAYLIVTPGYRNYEVNATSAKAAVLGIYPRIEKCEEGSKQEQVYAFLLHNCYQPDFVVYETPEYTNQPDWRNHTVYYVGISIDSSNKPAYEVATAESVVKVTQKLARSGRQIYPISAQQFETLKYLNVPEVP